MRRYLILFLPLQESFQIELKKITDDAASRVEKVMKKSEEQAIMIESLHRSVCLTYSSFKDRKSFCVENITLFAACTMNHKVAYCYSLLLQVAMYRKLCEEQQKARSNVESAPNALQGLFYFAFSFDLSCPLVE